MLLGHLCLCPVFQTKPVKATRKYRSSYSAQALLGAYESVKLKGLSVHRAAIQFGVPEQKLRDRVKGRIDHTNLKLGSETVFSNEEELTLVEHLEAMCDLGYGYTNSLLKQTAGELANSLGKRAKTTPLSNNWLYGFLRRWGSRLTTLKPSSLDSTRAKSATPEKISSYYDSLNETLKKHQLLDKPQFIYNIDETGIQPDHRPPNIIASVNSKPQSITSPRSTTTTVIGCVNAVGNSLPPFFVFKGKRFNPNLMKGASPGSNYAMSESGWSNGQIFKDYLENHFLPNVRSRTDNSQPILILFDGHASHCSSTLIEWAQTHNLILFVLPAHTSHLLQPLDVSIFGPFKNFYYSECTSFMRDNIGRNITKYDMCAITCRAYLRAMTPMNIIAGFKKTGIYPLSKESVPPEKLFPSEIFREEEPLKKVQAIKGGKEAVDKFLSTKVQKSTEEKCTCKCQCMKANPSIVKPNPGGKEITEESFRKSLSEYQANKSSNSVQPKKSKSLKSKSQKSTVNNKVALSPKPSTSGISLQRNVVEVIPSDTESDDESQYEESELCCVCHKFSPPNLKERPYLKIVNWASCEKCGHWVHLSFCTKQVVVRRKDIFLCPHCHQ